MWNRLFARTDNAPLIVFRIFFGFLLACETFGAICTGWVYNVLVKPQFTFSHIGMEWLQPLPGNGMYYYFAVMGILGLLVMLGYKYRYALGGFTILWAGAYFMQKSSYNNHYYLLLLVCIIMLFLPASRYASVDAVRNPEIKKTDMPAWCSGVMVLQIAIVYFFATVAKFYPGWVKGDFTRILLDNYTHGAFHAIAVQKWFYLFIAYAGIAFDMLVIPLFLYRKTRTLALIASFIFHMFNAVVLQIGIFPFFALSFVIFFYPPEKVRKIFLPKKPPVTDSTPVYENKKILKYFFIPYFIIQLFLPLRHHFIKGDVGWTEEGHRLSWRMMLRSRNGFTSFRVIDKKTGRHLYCNLRKELTPKQFNAVKTHPDMMWQMAQHLKQEFKSKGIDVAVFADSRVSVNGGPYYTLIDPNTDLSGVSWDYFFHNSWILLYDDNGRVIR